MNSIDPKAEPLLHFYNIESFEISLDGEIVYPEANYHTLILCLSGTGLLVTADGYSELRYDSAYLLGPEQSYRLLAKDEHIKGYLLRFEAYTMTTKQHYLITNDFIQGLVTIINHQQLAKSCHTLLQLQATEQSSNFREQAEFYHIMSLLTLSQSQPNEEESTASAITRVSNFMEHNLDRELTRKELSVLAGLSPGYFSLAFQQHTGKTPTAYLIDLRMRRAKEILMSGGSVKETASKVGFDDEFYFSRRFKQRLGLSPLTFIKSRRSNIASVSDPISGNLLALQLLPKAAAFYPHHESYKRIVRLHSYEDENREVWKHNLDMLREADPKLIFCTDILSQQARQQLESIAPTVPIPWLSADWRQQLQAIAEVAEQREEASLWLSEYDRKAEKVYRKVRSKIGGATLNIWRIMGSEYRIYGNRNAGAVLYDDFNLTATHNLNKVDVFSTVSQEELISYDADILLIMVDPTAQAARSWAELQSSHLWSQLLAVKGNGIYHIGTEKLFEYSAWSHERALSYFMTMFS